MRGKSYGFTLLELLVIIAIIAILAAIILPVFALVKDTSRRTVCTSNLRQISNAILQYAGDNGNRLPLWTIDGVWQWDEAIYGYVKNKNAFTCPNNSAKVRAPQGMVIRAFALPKNVSGISLAEIPRPTLTVMLFEKGSQPVFSWGDATGEMFYQIWNVSYNPSYYPHERAKNFSFIDGHVRMFRLGSGPFMYQFDRRYAKGYCGNLKGFDISNDSEPGANLPR
ncbi:MAG: prepilin-type N-terminal cleavage/methylation domain-containing protein [Armatimonadetes bacterium]|nr:prepilin-type N-terminal cleavage/methylation domain-containing protein [Armatimonadota bacterium]